MGCEGWRICTIDDLKAPTHGAIAIGPFGSRMKSDCYVPFGVPVIRGTNISFTRGFTGEFVFIAPEFADSLGNAIVRAGDLVFPHRGSIGLVGMVPADGNPRYALSTSLMKLTCNTTKADPAFLLYFFRSPRGRHELLKHASTVGTPGIGQPLTSLRSIRLLLPPLPEQKRIAHILGTLDDKIELNRRMNATLEAMSRAIFKSWFVDFEPVRQNAAGQQPVGMDAQTATLFPDSFEDSEIGELPTGWMAGALGDCVDVVDCLHTKKPERVEGGGPLLQLANIRDDGLLDMDDTYFISEEDYGKWSAKFTTQVGDCVITNVGRVGAVAQIPPGVSAALGRNMTGLRPKSVFPYPTFLLECLLSASMRDEIERKTDSGTILNALNVKNIPRLRLPMPPDSIAAAFEQKVRSLRATMERCLTESRTLATLRDTLLPKLLSGEFRVPEAEGMVEEAVG